MILLYRIKVLYNIKLDLLDEREKYNKTIHFYVETYIFLRDTDFSNEQSFLKYKKNEKHVSSRTTFVIRDKRFLKYVIQA